MKLRHFLVAAVALLLVPLTSHAAEKTGIKLGQVTVGGGVSGFTNDLNRNTKVGGTWGAQVGINAPKVPIVGLELAYEGGANAVHDPLIAGTPTLVRNGGTADLKIRPFAGLAPNSPVQMIALGGIGFTRFNFPQSKFGGVYTSHTMTELPTGIGLEYGVGNFIGGVRGTYTFLTNKNFTSFKDRNDGQIWTTQATLGGQF